MGGGGCLQVVEPSAPRPCRKPDLVPSWQRGSLLLVCKTRRPYHRVSSFLRPPFLPQLLVLGGYYNVLSLPPGPAWSPSITRLESLLPCAPSARGSCRTRPRLEIVRRVCIILVPTAQHDPQAVRSMRTRPRALGCATGGPRIY